MHEYCVYIISIFPPLPIPPMYLNYLSNSWSFYVWIYDLIWVELPTLNPNSQLKKPMKSWTSRKPIHLLTPATATWELLQGFQSPTIMVIPSNLSLYTWGSLDISQASWPHIELPNICYLQPWADQRLLNIEQLKFILRVTGSSSHAFELCYCLPVWTVSEGQYTPCWSPRLPPK